MNTNLPKPAASFSELASQKRSRVKTAVYTIAGISTFFLTSALLMQGCKEPPPPSPIEPASEVTNNIPEPTNNPTIGSEMGAPMGGQPVGGGQPMGGQTPVGGQTPIGGQPVGGPPPVGGQPPVGVEPVPMGGVQPTPIGTQPLPTGTQPPAGVTPPPSEGGEYIVVKGDTLFTIAKKNNVTLKALQAANPGVDSKKLKIGQKLKLPAGGVTAPAPAPQSGTSTSPGTHAPAPALESASGSDVYAVKSGDTLTKIAKNHGTTVKNLRAANNLSSDKLTVGQKLKIPAKGAAPAPVAPAAPATAEVPPPVTSAAPSATPMAPASPAPLTPGTPVR